MGLGKMMNKNMNYYDKIELYNTLVNDVKRCPKLDKCNQVRGKNNIQLIKCDLCNEINLWTYWQGGRNNLDAAILLVGQDWGSYIDKDGKSLLNFISERENDPEYPYIRSDDTPYKNPTDFNLMKLFDECLGVKIGREFVSNHNLFFTNFVLCYRNNGERISGNFKKIWVDNCSEYFVRLVNIIEPKIVICLGRNVFDSVLRAANVRIPKEKYNRIIESGCQTITIGNINCAVFPLAHCGTYGTHNRNRGQKVNEDLKLQKQDWYRIKQYIDNHNIQIDDMKRI